MRIMISLGMTLVLLGPTAAWTQPAVEVSGATEPDAAAIQLRWPVAAPPHLTRSHDSIKKAALAGAAVGAVVGVLFVNAQCENHCEAGAFGASMVYFSALGAGIGAMIAVMPDRTGVGIGPDRRLRVMSVVRRSTKAGLVSVRF